VIDGGRRGDTNIGAPSAIVLTTATVEWQALLTGPFGVSTGRQLEAAPPRQLDNL
jgi:hypothetical protein